MIWKVSAIVFVVAAAFVAAFISPVLTLPADADAAAQVAAQCPREYSSKGIKVLATGAVCILGEIDKQIAGELRDTELRDGAMVVLDSPGGDAESALDIADKILAKHVNVVVRGLCLSACANYLFITGVRKYVLPGSLLGFHGGVGNFNPTTVTFIGPETMRAAAMVQGRIATIALAARQTELYRRLGVDIRLIFLSPPGFPFTQADIPHKFWEYGPRTLAERFGVKGLGYVATPADRAYAIRMLGISCRRVSDDVWGCIT